MVLALKDVRPSWADEFAILAVPWKLALASVPLVLIAAYVLVAFVGWSSRSD